MHHRFNILDRHQEIKKNYLLEASAGTGKTFAIENLVIRMLLEDFVSLEQILIVTFTKAATRDLKIRIRSNLEKSITSLLNPSPEIADYLAAVIEKGPEEIKTAKKNLERALFCFDSAQIFTIHGFCARMLKENALEGNISFNTTKEESTVSDVEIQKVIRDYIRTELTPDSYSPAQLTRLLTAYDQSYEKLELALIRALKSGYIFKPLPSYSSFFLRFQEAYRTCHFPITDADLIVQDFIKQAPNFEKLCDKNNNVKIDILQKVENFSKILIKKEPEEEDFEYLIKEGLFLVEALHPDRLKKKGKKLPDEELSYPNLVPILENKLYKIIEEARHPTFLFSRLGYGCQEIFEKFLQEEELITFDQLLLKMCDALKNATFIKNIRQKYQLAIIDEFQDTDPIQWEIFYSLFANEEYKGHFYLVGDPKQSIYAFRQADIYTYLQAAEVLGKENIASLDTNYRSQHSLIEGLNVLFSQNSSPGLIALPKLKKSLIYNRVESNSAQKKKHFQDNRGAINFCLSNIQDQKRSFSLEYLEENFLFPFFAKEISSLHREENLPFSEFAILVSDRFQTERLLNYFKRMQIPIVAQKTTALAESTVLSSLYELLYAILHPRKESALKTALGGKILGWNHLELANINDPIVYEALLVKFYQLRAIWQKEGFYRLFPEILQTIWNNTTLTVMEKLLSQENGISLVDELQQLANFLMEEESSKYFSPESFLEYLDKLYLNRKNDQQPKKLQDSTLDAVQVLTLHSSKGLEFGIVFALGLITRTKAPELLVPITSQGKTFLKPLFSQEEQEYKDFCNELDAEKMRQLYVGMTRAKFRLYLPVVAYNENQAPDFGRASPMELFLARLGQNELSTENLYANLASYNGEILKNFIKNHQNIENLNLIELTSYLNTEEEPYHFSLEKKEPSSLFPIQEFQITYNARSLFSFSSLLTSKEKAPTILQAPHDFLINHKEKSPHTLPSGSETGTLLHKIFEIISFQASRLEIQKLVEEKILNTPYQEWKEVIIEIIETTLHAKLQGKEETFSLSHIHEEFRYQELTFLYPCKDPELFPEMSFEAGFLKGVIDLIFIYQNRYYILDWKSNWLGNGLDFYNQSNMENSMVEHHYFLQAKIYKEALFRYLKLVDPRPFNEIFGGIYYLFLRGISSEGTTGIYHFK